MTQQAPPHSIDTEVLPPQQTDIDAPQQVAIDAEVDTLIHTVAATQQEALHTMETAGQAVFRGLSEVQHEIADFVAERIRQDVETHHDLMRCRSFDDVRQVQTRFLRNAFDQYSAETSRLIKLSGQLAAPVLDRSPN